MKKLFVVALVGAAVSLIAAHTVEAQQKTEKACQEEWRANKAANQEAKITEKAYVDKCREGAAKPEAAKPAAPAAAPAPTAAKPMQAPPATTAAPTAAKPMQAPAAAVKPEAMKPAAAAPAKNQFATEALAKGHCPSDTVVYVNLKSDIYHFAGNKDYGNLKDGTFMCEKDTAGVGARAAKNEKHP